MAKKVTQLDEYTGKVVTGKLGRRHSGVSSDWPEGVKKMGRATSAAESVAQIARALRGKR